MRMQFHRKNLLFSDHVLSQQQGRLYRIATIVIEKDDGSSDDQDEEQEVDIDEKCALFAAFDDSS